MRPWNTYALLTAAGREPRVEHLRIPEMQTSPIMTFAAGSSVYALACSPDGTYLAIGTKTGSVTECSVKGGTNSPQELATTARRLQHGNAPVLDMVFVSPQRLAVTYANGGCWLYDMDADPPHMTNMSTGQQVVCSLIRLGNDILVGLTTKGKLIFWDLVNFRVVYEIQGPDLPLHRALVCLRFWKKINSLIYPSSDGDLVVFDIAKAKLRQHPAHLGEWYMMAVADDHCLTVGTDDGIAKVWDENLNAAKAVVKGPCGVIAGGYVSGGSSSLLLITQNGTAGLYRTDKGNLQCTKQFSGKDYRVFIPPVPAVVASFEDEAAQAAAQRIVSEIQTGASEGEERRALFEQLDNLGYRHVSLALQADHAIQADDLAVALRCTASLTELLPVDQAASRRSLMHHAELLEKAWRYKEAVEVFERMNTADATAIASLERLKQHSEALACPAAISEIDLPLPLLCDCATAVNKKLQGHWLVKRLKPFAFHGAEITAEQFLAKCAKLHNESAHDFPTAQAETGTYVTRTSVTKCPSVFFTVCPQAARPTFELWLRFEKTVITPLVVFFIPPSESKVSIEEHNNKARDRFLRLRDQDLIKSQLKTILNASFHTCRRVLTEQLGQKHTTTGEIHD